MPFQINTGSLFSSPFPHTSDRPQHQMPINVCGNMQDAKHLQKSSDHFCNVSKVRHSLQGISTEKKQNLEDILS